MQVSSETAPPGGYAQFKISLTAPALVSAASMPIAFDPTIFGSVISVSAFSATGDQTGSVFPNGQGIIASVTSSSASLGQLPQMPVFVVTVPVLASAKIGAISSIVFDPTQSPSPWVDQLGNTYTVTVNPGTFTVGGTLSIQSVTPGGGLLPSGTVLAIDGTGFDATTTVTIDGVALGSTQLVNPQQLNVTLGGSTEMSGKHVHVSNPTGASVDYFAALQPTSPGDIVLILPQLPSPQYTAVAWDYPISSAVYYYSCLQNPNAFPVTAIYYFANSGHQVTSQSIVIPPYALYVVDNSTFAHGLGQIYMTVSAPIRMAEYRSVRTLSGGVTVTPPAKMTNLGSLGLQLSAGTFSWNWQLGTPAPMPLLASAFSGFPFTVSVSGAGTWLNVTPAPFSGGEALLKLTPLVSNLAAGSYTATVTVLEQLPPDLAQLGPSSWTFNVTLNASSQPTLGAGGGELFQMTLGGATPAPLTIPVTTNGTAAAFTTALTPVSGGNWLSVTPSSGTAPASLTATANPSGLAAGIYQADLKIQGPINTLDLTVQLYISAPPPGSLNVSPASVNFSLTSGSTASQQIAIITPTPSISVSANTPGGGNWLTASAIGLAVQVNASAVNLFPGTYSGTVTITSPLNLVATVPVSLTVAAAPPPTGPGQLSVMPSALTLSAPTGTTASGGLNVNVVSGNPYFTLQTDLGPPFVVGVRVSAPSSPNQLIAPATIVVSATASQPGTYLGSITISWNGGSATVPVTYYATAIPSAPPVITAIVSSGSALPGPIAPGELISIFGEGLGGQVLIDDIAAPVIYSSSGQVNAIVPYEAGSGAASIQVVSAGIKSGAWAVLVAPAAPSIFTLNGSGVGQAAIVNQDGTINGPSNPAARGATIQIYATGGGQTSPPSSTGTVADSAANLVLPIQITIGGVSAQVLYAGSAPGEIDGVVQINAIVPPTVIPGPSVPVRIGLGASATISVK